MESFEKSHHVLTGSGEFEESFEPGRYLEVIELDKSGVVQRKWLHEPNDTITLIHPVNKPGSIFSQLGREWRKGIIESFLPVGFPHSVSADYLAYQMYDSLQAFFSTITSLLANRALLQGLGVGDADSSATFALLLTILKDVMSRIATIVFAHSFGLRIEPDAKRYRFLADLFNDAAFFLELYSPYLSPVGKVVALSTGEALRALCGVAAGASKAALSVHFAKHDNLAELNAKEASQETAVGLVGLLIGTVVVKTIEDHKTVVCLMVFLVIGHLWMNFLGVRSVCMDTLNRQRATILFSEYLETGEILSPEQVAEREHIVFWNSTFRDNEHRSIARIEVARSYEQAAKGKSLIVNENKYTLYAHLHANNAAKLVTLRILLREGASPTDAIQSWYAAMRVAKYIGMRRLAETSDNPVTEVRTAVEKEWPKLRQLMTETGWNLNTQAFETAAPIRLRLQSREKKEL